VTALMTVDLSFGIGTSIGAGREQEIFERGVIEEAVHRLRDGRPALVRGARWVLAADAVAEEATALVDELELGDDISEGDVRRIFGETETAAGAARGFENAALGEQAEDFREIVARCFDGVGYFLHANGAARVT